MKITYVVCIIFLLDDASLGHFRVNLIGYACDFLKNYLPWYILGMKNM